MTFDSVTYDDRPFYQRIGYKIGSRPITMTHEKPANAPARITASTVESEVATLNSQPGSNPVAKAIVLLCSRNPAFASLDWATQNFRAGAYVRQLMSGTAPPATATPTKAEQAASILDAIKKMPGTDLVTKCVAYCKANSILPLTTVAADLQPQAATGLLAQLQAGDPSGFLSGPAAVDGTGVSQLAARMPKNVQSIVDAINSQDGPNVYAKANAYLCGASASHRARPLHEQHRVAGEFTRTVLSGKLPVL